MTPRLLLIDNYDSFTYNLVQAFLVLGADVIVDRVQGIFGQATTPLAGEYANHEITRDMREVTSFPMTRSRTMHWPESLSIRGNSMLP